MRTSWKPSQIYDPVLALAGHHNLPASSALTDRFSVNSDFLANNIGPPMNAYWKGGNISKNKDRPEQQRQQKYEGLLCQACGLKQGRKFKGSKAQKSNYSSKIKRNGYILDQPDENQQNEEINTPRKITDSPYRILSAPRLKDDFYTSLLDWSPQDIVSVVLDNAAYIWSSRESETEKLVEGYISSIKWGKDLTIGQESGRMRVIDVEKKMEIAKIRQHSSRIGSIDCYGHLKNLIASGSKDNTVMVWDARSKETTHKFQGHRQEVCGVKWSFDGNMIASGGNDNAVAIWDVRASKLYAKFTDHQAAVKALAWSPHQSCTLATGGGSTDKCIRIWNTIQKKCTRVVETGSQICNMMYSVNSNELVSTHGFSYNSINVWNAKDMTKTGTLTGHTYRVLFLARSPDGESILTGSGDQTLRFWKLFPRSEGLQSTSSTLEGKTSDMR